MKYAVTILDLIPCGCDEEGEVIAELENGLIVNFYYQGSDVQAIRKFQIGKTIEIDLIGQLCSAKATKSDITTFNFPKNSSYFQAEGKLLRTRLIDDEEYFILKSNLILDFQIEFGELSLPNGSNIYVSGELWANDWW